MLLQFCSGVREAQESEIKDDCYLNIYLSGGDTFNWVGEKKKLLN